MEEKTVNEKWGSEASREDAHPIMLVALSHTMFKIFLFMGNLVHVDTLSFR